MERIKALASRSSLNVDIRHMQVGVFNVRQDRSRRGHHYEETWPRSFPSSSRGPETDMSTCPGWKLNPAHPPWWEAGEHSSKVLFEQLNHLHELETVQKMLL